MLYFLVQQGIIEKYGLALQASGFFAGYDININSGIANSVASQALQFVASLMPNTVDYFNEVSIEVKKELVRIWIITSFDLC